MRKRIGFFVLILLIVFGIVIFDQVTKKYAREYLKGHGLVRVVDTLVVLKYAENDGAFLGLGSGLVQPYKTLFLILFPVVVITGAVIYLFVGKELSVGRAICLSSIIGGGISNILDRIINNGYVTDFLNFGIGRFRTGILNFADMFITFGAIFLALSIYLSDTHVSRERDGGREEKN